MMNIYSIPSPFDLHLYNLYILGSNISGLAFDKYSQLLYFTEPDRHTISVLDVRRGGVKLLMADNEDISPGALVLHQQHGFVYMVDQEHSYHTLTWLIRNMEIMVLHRLLIYLAMQFNKYIIPINNLNNKM